MCFVTRLPVILIFGILLLQGLLVDESYGYNVSGCSTPVPQICGEPVLLRRCNIPENVCLPYIEGSKLNFPEIDDSSIAILRK
ncbi:hypothetical protein KM043_012635 [Ampulex compressa]|uniref:Venom protein n=1 Tax=Ampulex compressa TaxID=860918 RepID=A0A1W6EVR8_AMPCP|nr:venom protein [Ampulex compressa]KAG7212310.1 hypothetical protein KM043_012635 [Ampulex compressa]